MLEAVLQRVWDFVGIEGEREGPGTEEYSHGPDWPREGTGEIVSQATEWK